MSLSIGIVGLPNVGKSTLFNALSKQKVLAANYPFATIDPNIGIVNVADKRLYQIADISKPEKIIPATIEFVDIAGLVKGASEGAGLGNKFLSHIREVSVILHLVRGFTKNDIVHVENSINPERDIDLINTELILKDIETIENKINSIKSKSRFDEKIKEQINVLMDLYKFLGSGNLAIDFLEEHKNNLEIQKNIKELCLLTSKPMIYLVNVEDNNSSEMLKKIQNKVGNSKIVISMDVQQEYELSTMEEMDKQEFMRELKIEETGIEKLSRIAYKTLDLITFFTEGAKEVRAWTIKKGTNAQEASGVIHTDFQKNFIAMEVVKFVDFIKFVGWQKAKENGKMFLGGRDYIVQDGDIVIIKHNAR